jgi:polar amino acid transport system substrate-binding protein
MGQWVDRYRKLVVRALLSVALAAIAQPAFARNEKIDIVTEEWPPYNYTEDGVIKGFSVEIIRHIIGDLNVDADFKVVPSMRAKLMLDSNPRTMMITMLRTPEREQHYQWIGPLGDGVIYFYKKKGNPLLISTLEDAKKVGQIACRHAGLVFNTLTAAGFTNLDATSTNGESIYRKLLNDRCDLGVSETDLGVKYILRQMNYPSDALVQTGVKVVESPLYIACGKDVPAEEVARWQESLDRMKASGAYDEVYRKYSE